MRSPADRRRGFTYIDLTVGLLIAGVFTSMAIPPLVSVRDSVLVRTGVDRFHAYQSLARGLAIRHGRMAELHIDTATSTVWVEMDTTVARTGVTDTLSSVLDLSRDGLEIDSDRDVICYDARGLAAISPRCGPGDGTVVLSRPGHADTVMVTALGKVVGRR